MSLGRPASGCAAVHSKEWFPIPQTAMKVHPAFRLLGFPLLALATALLAAQAAPPDSEKPAVIEEKDIPRKEILTSAIVAARPPNAQAVILEAHLDDNLHNHLDILAPGEADGRMMLTDYVMVENGKDLYDFVKKHGYQGFRGPVGIRKGKTRLEVAVEITAPDGARMVAWLSYDGTRQGCG